MTALRSLSFEPPSLRRPRSSSARAPGAQVSAEESVLLDWLRRLARRAQLSAPIAVDHVCSLGAPASAETYGLALMRTLDAVAKRPLVFHRSGSSEAGFDELWLLALLRALNDGDSASARLLIVSRAGRSGQRAVAFLAQGVAARLARPGLDEDGGYSF